MHTAIKTIAAAVLGLVLAACGSLRGRHPAPSAEAVEPPATVEPIETAAPAPVELAPIVAMLEDGRWEECRRQLQGILAADPDQRVARHLLEQLDADPQAYLGPAHRTHTVVAGDTLSGLAARYLGDPLAFLILARYNRIAYPKVLQVGQVLKIPTGYRAPAGPAGSGRAPGAGAGPAGAGLAPPERRAQALLWQQRGIERMQGAEVAAHEAAFAAFGTALAYDPTLEPARQHREALRATLVSDYHRAAVVQYRNQQLDQALALWDKALALDPAYEPALNHRTRALELKRRLQELDSPPESRSRP